MKIPSVCFSACFFKIVVDVLKAKIFLHFLHSTYLAVLMKFSQTTEVDFLYLLRYAVADDGSYDISSTPDVFNASSLDFSDS